MRRGWRGVGALLLVAALSCPVFAQEAGDVERTTTAAPVPDAQAEPGPTCIARSGSLTVTATLQTLAAALEINLLVSNAGPVAVRVDPSKAVLATAEGVQTPWTAAQVKRAHSDLGAYIVAGALFPPLLAITGISQLNFNRYVDGRALRAGDVAPGGTLRGSIFFAMPPETQSRAALDLTGLISDLGNARPIRLYCPLPRGPSAYAASGAFVPLTVSLGASAARGAAEVSVDLVEFAADYTAVELRMTNKGDAPAEIFGAMVNATLRDETGTIYAGFPARGDFRDRVPAKQTVPARLVFAPLPLPPKTTAAILTIPGIRFGPEDAIDLTVVLRF